MNFYIKKQYFPYSKFLLKIFTIIVLVFFLNIFRAPVKNYFFAVFSPISSFFPNFSEGFNNLWSLPFRSSTENEKIDLIRRLTDDNQRLLLSIAELNDLLKETNSVIEIGKFLEAEKFKTTFVRILGTDARNDFMIINKGEEDGLKENMPVISEKKILYGKIIEIHKNFSKVLLISAKNNTVSVKTENGKSNPIYGAVKGEGNLSIRLDLVETSSEIKEEDTLITSALEGIFPANLLVGKIKTVNKNDQQPFQTAKAEKFFNITATDGVFVITDYLKK